METVGFIGLGKMGSGMSVSIQKAGYSMVVYDLREEAAKPLLEGGARLANFAPAATRPLPPRLRSLESVVFDSKGGPPCLRSPRPWTAQLGPRF
jgi:UDP-N-acetylmuramoylalanine-D-glutamate ligase